MATSSNVRRLNFLTPDPEIKTHLLPRVDNNHVEQIIFPHIPRSQGSNLIWKQLNSTLFIGLFLSRHAKLHVCYIFSTLTKNIVIFDCSQFNEEIYHYFAVTNDHCTIVTNKNTYDIDTTTAQYRRLIVSKPKLEIKNTPERGLPLDLFSPYYDCMSPNGLFKFSYHESKFYLLDTKSNTVTVTSIVGPNRYHINCSCFVDNDSIAAIEQWIQGKSPSIYLIKISDLKSGKPLDINTISYPLPEEKRRLTMLRNGFDNNFCVHPNGKYFAIQALHYKSGDERKEKDKKNRFSSVSSFFQYVTTKSDDYSDEYVLQLYEIKPHSHDVVLIKESVSKTQYSLQGFSYDYELILKSKCEFFTLNLKSLELIPQKLNKLTKKIEAQYLGSQSQPINYLWWAHYMNDNTYALLQEMQTEMTKITIWLITSNYNHCEFASFADLINTFMSIPALHNVPTSLFSIMADYTSVTFLEKVAFGYESPIAAPYRAARTEVNYNCSQLVDQIDGILYCTPDFTLSSRNAFLQKL